MIDRETLISRSVEAYLRVQLFTIRQYPTTNVELLDAYPDNVRQNKKLDKNYIAVGYNFDDGGRQAELGSTLKRRLHTLDFHIFAVSRVWGKNLAGILRSSLESDGTINLVNPTDSTVVGYLTVDFVSAQQAPTQNARPWQENVWIVRLRVEDYHDPNASG